LPTVVGALGPRIGPLQTNDIPTLDECAAALGYNAWEEKEIAAAAVQQFSRPPFLDQIDHAERQTRDQHEQKEREAAFTSRDAERAHAICRAAIASNPDDWQLQHNYGTLALFTGDYASAATHLERVVARFPDWIPPRMTLGSALAQLGRRLEAEAQFQACLRIDRNFTPARQALSQLQGRAGR
jgi:Flp pilus assembly protein TadD